VLRSSLLSELPWIDHGFGTRTDVVSQDGMARLKQIHSAVVLGAGGAGVAGDGDALVTAQTGVPVSIRTADCYPILLADPRNFAVAAVHAGWRGTLAGIAAEGVRAMVALGARPASIRAALGPSIGLCCFEVNAALAENFARQIPDANVHTRPGRLSKAFLDLRSIVRTQLEREGLESASIVNAGPCTRCANDRYFSRRGAAASGLFTTSGLQMSFIGFAK